MFKQILSLFFLFVSTALFAGPPPVPEGIIKVVTDEINTIWETIIPQGQYDLYFSETGANVKNKFTNVNYSIDIEYGTGVEQSRDEFWKELQKVFFGKNPQITQIRSITLVGNNPLTPKISYIVTLNQTKYLFASQFKLVQDHDSYMVDYWKNNYSSLFPQ